MFYLITVKWMGGFTHVVPTRRYNLKSQLEFTKSLDYVEKVTYVETTEDEYNRYIYGDELWESLRHAGTESKKSKTRTRSPSKRGTSVKKDGPKPSTTKRSAPAAKKSTKKKATSSTPVKKKTTGSTPAKKTVKKPAAKKAPAKKKVTKNEPAKTKRVRKA